MVREKKAKKWKFEVKMGGYLNLKQPPTHANIDRTNKYNMQRLKNQQENFGTLEKLSHAAIQYPSYP